MPELTKGEAQALLGATRRFIEVFERDVVEVLSAELRGAQPAQVIEVREQLSLLSRQLELKPKTLRVHDAHAGLLKRIVIDERRRAAEAIDEPLRKAIQSEVVKLLHRELRPLDELMTSEWFREAKATRLPRLTDYLSIRFAERATVALAPLAPRVFDEKFHILEAPALLAGDLAHYRQKCLHRDAPFTIAYLDIDDFKAINTRFTETVVDLKLLAPFMETLEASVFAHGHAYRFGGDEYVLLLPNTSRRFAIDFLAEVARRIAEKRYVGLDARTSISIGACHVDSECPLTDRELVVRANQAKNVAKQRKGSMALCEGPLYAEADITIVEASPV